MIINNDEIIIRNYTEQDILDDIKWFNLENDWIYLDTPWENIEFLDEKNYTLEMRKIFKKNNKKSINSRYEIEINNHHVGFVTVYRLDIEEIGLLNKYAIGIEICDKQYRNKGYGKKVLDLFTKFLFSNNIMELYLETHSKNVPMINCSKANGFDVIYREVGKWKTDRQTYDRIIMAKYK